MKAEKYLALVMRRETGKSEKEAQALARRTVRTAKVQPIKEGPESE